MGGDFNILGLGGFAHPGWGARSPPPPPPPPPRDKASRERYPLSLKKKLFTFALTLLWNQLPSSLKPALSQMTTTWG